MLFKDADDCLRRLLKIGILVLRLGHADWRMHANDMPLSRLLMNEHRQDRDVKKSGDCRRSGRPACSVAEKLRRNRILDVVDALVHEKIHKIALPHAAIELSRLVRINDADGADFPRQLVPRVKLLTADQRRKGRRNMVRHAEAEQFPISAVQCDENAAFAAGKGLLRLRIRLVSDILLHVLRNQRYAEPFHAHGAVPFKAGPQDSLRLLRRRAEIFSKAQPRTIFPMLGQKMPNAGADDTSQTGRAAFGKHPAKSGECQRRPIHRIRGYFHFQHLP